MTSVRRKDAAIQVNEDSELWITDSQAQLDETLETNDFLRKYRSTACPVMGDDDIADDAEKEDSDDNTESSTSEK